MAQRYFSGRDLGLYTAAGLLGRALPMVVGPMLTVLFTSRSGHRTEGACANSWSCWALYAVGLAQGPPACCSCADFWVRLIFGKYTPEAAAMVSRLAVTMAFIGLMQAVGMWALASRWLKVALSLWGVRAGLLVGALAWGTSPPVMLQLMPVAAGVGLWPAVSFRGWSAMRTSHPGRRSNFAVQALMPIPGDKRCKSYIPSPHKVVRDFP